MAARRLFATISRFGNEKLSRTRQTGLPDPSFRFAVFDAFVNDKAGKLFKSDDD